MKINIHTHNIAKSEYAIFNLSVGIKGYNTTNSFFSLGIHPWHINKKIISFLWDEFLFYTNNKNCIAIGEIGFDTFSKASLELQKYIFIKQASFAENNDLPIIIHCVKSYDKILQMRKIFNKTPWIIHDFTGNIELALQLIKKNIYISLGKNFLKKTSKIQKILPLLPTDKIFFETDNSILSIDTIYKKAEKILRIDEKDLEIIVLNNFKTVFNGIKF